MAVGGHLEVGGTSQTFFDLIQYTSAGDIQLFSNAGDVSVGATSSLNVSAQPGGGDAGSVSFSVPQGAFNLLGSMLGKPGIGGVAGTFSLDVGKFEDVAAVASTLGLGDSTSRTPSACEQVMSPLTALSRLMISLCLPMAGRFSLHRMARLTLPVPVGGTINLVAAGSVVLKDGALLTVEGDDFSSAGKGGVSLEAGAAINGIAPSAADCAMSARGLFADGTAVVDIEQNSMINLGVKSTYDIHGVPDPAKLTAAAALGEFTGALHLLAPQTKGQNDVQVNPILGNIEGSPSSLVIEGYRVYQTSSIDAVEGQIYSNSTTFCERHCRTIHHVVRRRKSLISGLAPAVVVVPGAEVVNLNGDLTLNSDWDLSSFRFDAKNGSRCSDPARHWQPCLQRRLE